MHFILSHRTYTIFALILWKVESGEFPIKCGKEINNLYEQYFMSNFSLLGFLFLELFCVLASSMKNILWPVFTNLFEFFSTLRRIALLLSGKVILKFHIILLCWHFSCVYM